MNRGAGVKSLAIFSRRYLNSAISDSSGQRQVLTGCVPETGERRIRVKEKTLTGIADLYAKDFSTGTFAEHLGPRIAVPDFTSEDGTRPTIKVRRFKQLNDVCAPR